MFDIGFTELLLVGIVALIVVGPERLPGLIRTILSYVRQFKASFSSIKNEVERELELDSLKNSITDNKNSISNAVGFDDIKSSIDELKDEADEFRNMGSSPFDTLSTYDTIDVTDEEIEADLALLSDEGPQLPSPDSEADTGIEAEIATSTETNKTTNA
ncbi:MAG: twin-arginine translocase subunit TatB [Gammaproteobacteria bacterium]|nr:twin-arginine translocase subunit TatB [Gammaproteobacteria bacterium]